METPIAEMIVSKVKALHQKLAPTPGDLAKKEGLSLDAVKKLETAVRKRLSTIRKLAKALDVAKSAITEPASHAEHRDSAYRSAVGGANDFSLDYLLPRRPPNFSTYAPETFTVAGARVKGTQLVDEAKSILRDHPGVSHSDIVTGVIVLRALEIYLEMLKTTHAHEERE